MLLFLLGCPEPAPIDSDDAPDTSDTEIEDTTPPVDTDPCPTEVASMSGQVVSANGGTVDGLRINLCRTFCDSKETQADGLFEYPEFAAGACAHALSIEDPTQGRYLTALTMVHAEDGEQRQGVVLTVVEPQATLAIPASGAQELDLCGVHVTMATDELDLPFGEEGTEASCARLAPEAWLPWDDLPGEALHVWYLAPYNAKGALPYFRTAVDCA